MTRRVVLLVALIASGVLALSGCAVDTPVPADFSLVQYPGAGFVGFYAQTAAAKTSIDMEMYELSDRIEEAALIAAAHRGVTVRVLLDSAYEEQQANEPAYDDLRANGVQVRWAPRQMIFHMKTTTFDGRTSDISTANLTSQYYSTTRDAEIIDRDKAQVGAIEQTFSNDWNGNGSPGGIANANGLIWSPDAESAMVNQISAARTSVDFTSEELSDPYIYHALADDASRGVHCRVVMMNETDWATAFAAVAAAGCRVHVFPDTATGFYVHEKEVLDDAGTPHASVMLGSQNASYSSLSFNRELSIILTHDEAPAIIAAVSGTFNHDFARARAWHG
jgi:cardiolipin synthase